MPLSVRIHHDYGVLDCTKLAKVSLELFIVAAGRETAHKNLHHVEVTTAASAATTATALLLGLLRITHCPLAANGAAIDIVRSAYCAIHGGTLFEGDEAKTPGAARLLVCHNDAVGDFSIL